MLTVVKILMKGIRRRSVRESKPGLQLGRAVTV